MPVEAVQLFSYIKESGYGAGGDQMNDKTLAKKAASVVRILDSRLDSADDFGPKARSRYGVARNLISQAIIEIHHADRYAMEEAGALVRMGATK